MHSLDLVHGDIKAVSVLSPSHCLPFQSLFSGQYSRRPWWQRLSCRLWAYFSATKQWNILTDYVAAWDLTLDGPGTFQCRRGQL